MFCQQVDLHLSDGSFYRAAVPSGASTGGPFLLQSSFFDHALTCCDMQTHAYMYASAFEKFTFVVVGADLVMGRVEAYHACRLFWVFFLSDPPQKRFISAMGFVATGTYEAVELRDGGKDYMGKGVRKVKKKSLLCTSSTT